MLGQQGQELKLCSLSVISKNTWWKRRELQEAAAGAEPLRLFQCRPAVGGEVLVLQRALSDGAIGTQSFILLHTFWLKS